ncbi:MAG: metallophosphoesterase [Proteobacteria bacterium]|nr:metallophosphoesterase [Pseudomonadota bacterium]MBU4295332.1 metallophosphoesterase [Pseudomonadota bacterium]MCG2748188.1 metallophosphoesterase [Desulfobulbaceae bacterium]
MPRKQHLFLATFFILLLLACYGYIVEPNNIKVEQVVIPDDYLHQVWGDARIVQLSDLHIDQIGQRDKRVLQLLTDIKPDLIVITGDMAQWNSDPQVALQFVESLKAPLGVYGILGDSDISSGRRYCVFCHAGGNVHQLRQHPRLLKNSTVEITVPATGKKVTIAGVFPTDEDAGLSALIDHFGQTAEPVLLLDHFSEGWQQIRPKGPLLWLAGDTHGGQIYLPDFIWRTFHLVDYPQYMAGLFSDGGHKWLYVNRGIGTVSYFPFRIGEPPEITVISF